MRRIVRTALWLMAAGVIGMFVIVGSVSFVVWRHTSITKPAPTEAEGVFSMIRERYKGRAPLI